MVDVDSKGSFATLSADSMKPFKGRKFISLKDGIEFYSNYARIIGFDTRLSTVSKVGDTIISRYILCSREGEKFIDVKERDFKRKRRKRDTMRCGCMARVVFKYESDVGYIVHTFIEEHNHPLVPQEFKHFLKLNRNIDYVHQKFILDCARTNIGASQSHKLLMEFLGGHDGVGCSVLDVRNYSRDMKAHVDGADAQMLLNEMNRKKEISPLFTFDYEVDKEDRLQRLFWCDSVSKKNYELFGDVVAFDTTYSTNKYCLIFAPFTGKDNHGKPVTFAAALLSKEDADSFSWLFEKFILCMGAAPKMIVTDQDLGMKVAIERVLVGTRHRWCMWHIMLKIADKVSKDLHANDEFKEDLKSIVWSDLIDPEVFEEGWDHIMMNYELDGDKWFDTMFECRAYWVPAYFRDFRFGGLMRTTSISECENNFFKSYSRCRSNLLQFLMNYNHAVASQRNSNSHLNYLDSCVVRKMDTSLLIEKHASMIYTIKIFRFVQDELLAASFKCRILEKNLIGNDEVYRIKDEKSTICKVVYNKDDESFSCCCNMFIRIGLLCRHIFVIFKNEGIECIPDKYVVKRWKMLSLLSSVSEVQNDDSTNSIADESKAMESKILRSVINCIGKIDGDKELLAELLSGINQLDGSILYSNNSLSKKKMFEEYYGASVPENIEVLPPNVVKTKGSGSRIISRKEKAARMLEKRARMCRKCMKMAYHDSRNCNNNVE